MAFPANRDLNRLTVHVTLQQLIWSLADGFSSVFLYRQGLTPAAIFLSIAVIFSLRFLLRPLVLAVVRWIGLKRTMIAGVVLSALQALLLAPVRGLDLALLAYLTVTALTGVFYWPTYHALFATVGDAERRGAQVGLRQALVAAAGIVGPAAGGLALTFGGPSLAFGSAALAAMVAIVPLLGCADRPVARVPPEGAYRAARRGALLFVSDGWIIGIVGCAWGLVVFKALGERYDAFGGVLAAAALAGAIGGLVLGHSIDAGGASRAVSINALVLAAILIAKALCGENAIAVLVVAIGAALLGGLYTPSLMTAIYNEAKASPCPLRYHLALEAGWDVGAVLACLAAAAVLAFGASLQVVILLALPVVALQAVGLWASYTAGSEAIGAIGGRTQGP
jgi:hypothetical protein